MLNWLLEVIAKLNKNNLHEKLPFYIAVIKFVSKAVNANVENIVNKKEQDADIFALCANNYLKNNGIFRFIKINNIRHFGNVLVVEVIPVHQQQMHTEGLNTVRKTLNL